MSRDELIGMVMFFWSLSFDTAEIAEVLDLSEYEIYRALQVGLARRRSSRQQESA